MKKHIKVFVLMLTSAIGLHNMVYAQAIYNIQNTKDVTMKINGTSTFHDWEMEANTATSVAQFIFNSANERELTSLKSFSFTLKVKDLKSNSKGLDRNAYDALKADKYKTIHYQLSSSDISPEKVGYLLKTNGKLTVAGFTKNIKMDVHIVNNEDGSITCKGAYQLNMTDYEVEPPTFMMGLMTTGDAITLDFKVTYKKENED